MLSRPSLTAVPGATISSALTSRGSCRASSSRYSSPRIRHEGKTSLLARSGARCLVSGACGLCAPVRRNAARARRASAGGSAASGQRRALAAPRRASSACGQRRRPHAGGARSVEPELARLGQAPVGVGRRGAARRSGPSSPKRPRGAPARAAARPSRAADATASATARSAPGSSTRTPPATTRTRRCRRGDGPPWRARTARISAEPVAVHAVRHPPRRHQLGRRHQRLDLDQQRARALHRAEHARSPARAWPPRTKRAEASSTSTRPPSRISNTPDLVGGAEAVLERAQRPVACARARPRSCSTQSTRCSSTRGPASAPSLVTWPTRITAHAALLGDAHRAGRRPRAPGRREPGAPVSAGSQSTCTESITQASRALGLDRGDHAVEVGLGHDRHRQRAAARAARRAASPGPPTPRPTRRARCARRRPGCPSAAHVSVDLPMPGRAADQHERARHEAAAEHAVELADAGAQRATAAASTSAQRAPARSAPAPSAGRRARRAAAARCSSTKRVPLPAARAAAVPLRALVPARGAGEEGAGAGHAARLSARVDGFAPATARTASIRPPA